MSFAQERAQALERATRIAESMTAHGLPGWAAHAPCESFPLARLVHTSGATATVTLARDRVILRGSNPERTSLSGWPRLVITVAANASPAQLVSHFTRRLETDLLAAHAQAVAEATAREQRCQQMRDLADDLRGLLPARIADEPWPQDGPGLRLRDMGRPHATGRVRVLSADTVEISFDYVPAAVARALLRAVAEVCR
ncbi:MAG: hypothetical protein GXX79_08485 [Actinomycetales bacterium]|nr:hypothetical protein [Actinomycetales bacterium]